MNNYTVDNSFDELQEKYPDLYREVIGVIDLVIEIRRDLHKHPELSFNETRTAAIVASNLKKWGYNVQENVGGTGVVGVLDGDIDGPVVGLRADMDALPMADLIQTSYRSEVENTAHTCGHDAHTAILLGVAKIFADRGLKKGKLKLIFQPAEEIGEGAAAMIADGVLENPKVDVMAGLHVHPTIETGEFSLAKTDYSCAAVDIFDLEIIGKGGHAAHPHTVIDPIMISAQVMVTIQQIVSRQTDPLDSVVISFGQINGGTKGTIIPEKVKISGTVRTLNPSTRSRVEKQIETISKNVSESLGGDCVLYYEHVTPSIKIDPSMRELFVESIGSLFTGNSLKLTAPSMGGEDFAYFSQQVPSVFFRLGTKGGESTSYSNHNPMFDVDERSFLYGISVLCHLTETYIQKK